MARYLRNTQSGAITIVQQDDDATLHTLLAQRTTPPDANTAVEPLYEETSEAWVLQHGGTSSTAPSAGGGAAVEVAQVGVTTGFDWVSPFSDGGNSGIQLVKIAGVVFAFGYAYFSGAFNPSAHVFSMPSDWADPNGTDLALFAHSDPSIHIGGYIGGDNSLQLGSVAGTVPDDSYVNFQAFWVTASPD